jgi:hypothetical protein
VVDGRNRDCYTLGARIVGLSPDRKEDPMTVTAESLGLMVPPRSAAETLLEIRAGIGRKFEPTDVDDTLRGLVEQWLEESPTGDNEFLTSVAAWADSGKTLTDGQVKGVANWATARKPNGSNGPKQPMWYVGVAEGRYAIGPGELRFYRVRRPAKGKWLGWTFCDRIVGGGDEGRYRRVPTSRAESEAAMEAIAGDPLGAGLRFSQEAKVCARCLKSLSDEESREHGYGPDCWKVVSPSDDGDY